MVMEHLEHIDGSNGQYQLHAGQGGFPPNDASFHHNLMYPQGGGYPYLGGPFTTGSTLSPQQQQAVLFAHSNPASSQHQPQQSSQQHQQHAQAPQQPQQGQPAQSSVPSNGSLGSFQTFSPSDQLGNEYAYFQAHSTTPSQPSTNQQNGFDTGNLVWANPIVGKPNGDPQQQQQLHAQQQAQFEAAQRALVQRQQQARAQQQQHQQAHQQAQAQAQQQAHHAQQEFHAAQQQHQLAHQRQQQQLQLQQQQQQQQQAVQQNLPKAAMQSLVPVQTPPPVQGKMTRSRSQPVRLGVLMNIQVRAATPQERESSFRALTEKRVFNFSEQWSTEAESESSEIEIMQPQQKKVKVEVVIPSRKNESTAQIFNSSQVQQQSHPQVQQAQRTQAQQSTHTPPPQIKQEHIKQESLEPQRQKPPVPLGPAELRWRLNTMISNMVPVHDPSGTALFENVKEFTEMMGGLDREELRKLATDCMDQAPASVIRAMASAGSAGKLFSGKVQTWLAKLINKEEDFNDEIASSIIRIFHNMEIPYSRLEALKFVKARKVIAKKHPKSATLRLVDLLLEKGKKLEGIEDAPVPAKQGMSSAPTLKRKSEDDANLSATKKPTPALPRTQQTAQRPSVPASTSAGQRPPGSSASVASKQSTGFFKALKPSEKPVIAKPAQPLPSFKKQAAPPPQAPSAPTTTFSSIFDQLKERQRKEEDAKSKRAEDKTKPEESKKTKKKKSVRWKMESELVEVKEFEVLEPEGEYYGGGSGVDHQWGDARSLDVSEGRDALNALKNRKMLEDEVDETIDWYQPIRLDTTEYYKRYADGERAPIKRFGKQPPKDEDAQIQKKREDTILVVQYFHEKDIPPSPAEPPEGETGIDDAPAYEPPPVTLPPASNGIPDLSKILAQFQKTAAASMVGATPPPNVSTPPIPQLAAPAAAPSAPAAETNPVDALLQNLRAMTQGAPAAPQPNIKLPEFNIPAIPQQPAAEQPPNPLASLLPSILGVGVSQPQQPVMPAVTPDISALFQSLNFPQPPQAQQQQQMQPQANDLLAGLFQQLNPGMANGWPQQQQQPNQYDYGQNMDWTHSNGRDEDRARNVREKVRERTGWNGDRDRDDHDRGNNFHNNKNQGGKHFNKDKKNKNKNNRKDKPFKKRTTPCTFFLQDKCLKGNECPFLHTMEQ